MPAHQFKIGDRVKVVAPDPDQGWEFIKGCGVGAVTGLEDSGEVCVLMEDVALMASGFDDEKPTGWYISAYSLRTLTPPAPDPLTATALELAEAVNGFWNERDPSDEEDFVDIEGKRFARALRAYRDARRPEPRARLRALIEQHGGDDKAALLAVIDSGEAS